MIDSSIKKYFSGCSNKTRVLIYLLATGDFSFDQVRKLTVGDLQRYCDLNHQLMSENGDFMLLCNDICFQKKTDDYIFINQSGRLMSEKDVQAILIRACARTGDNYQGHSLFVEKLKKDLVSKMM